MSSLLQINKTLEIFAKQHGDKFMNAVQGSDVWYQIKLGVLSASNAAKIVAKKDSETRLTYMAELCAQVCTGIMEEMNSKYTDWGHMNEDAARSHYEFITGETITQVPFIFKDHSFREGCSPDGLIGETKGIEIKCPFNTVHYIKFLTEDKIKSDYIWQYQYTLRVTGLNQWDFVQFDPRMKKKPIKILTVDRDDEKQKTFDDAVPQFISDMDKMLERAGVKFGDQWNQNPSKEASGQQSEVPKLSDQQDQMPFQEVM